MSFIDAHDFSVDLVLRVLGIASSTYYEWRVRDQPGPACPCGRRAAGHDRRDPRRTRVRGHLRLAAGVAGAAPARGAGPRKRVERIMRGTAAGAPTCATVGRVAQRNRIRGTRRPRTWSTGTSPQEPRTGYGWPTPPGSRAAKACSGWPPSATRSPTGSSAGRPLRRRDGSDPGRARVRHLLALRPRRAAHTSQRPRLSNYTSFRFSQRLQDNGIRPSMGVGRRLLRQRAHGELLVHPEDRTGLLPRTQLARPATKPEQRIFEYIDGWYNTRRIQEGARIATSAPTNTRPSGTPGSRNLTRLPSNPRAPKPDSWPISEGG